MFRLRFLLLLLPFSLLAQQEQLRDSLPNPFAVVDSLYREDQFYLAITYNRLLNTPAGFDQNGLATGIHFGFLRDMPINKPRTLAVALGLGLSWNKYHHNMLIETSGETPYQIIRDQGYDRNKLEQLCLEIPFEFRWRNSTPESTRFWRVYGGFKARYLLFSKSTFDGNSDRIVVFNNKDLQRWQFGPTLSMGYNTWNFHVFYSLNPLFANGTMEGTDLSMRHLNMGLIFYIL